MANDDLSLEEIIGLASIKRQTEAQLLKEVQNRVKSGADVNEQVDGGSTPVMTAAAEGFVSVVKFLIESGADLSKKNSFKEDVVACAKLSGSKEMLALVKSSMSSGSAVDNKKSIYFQPLAKTEAEYTFFPSKKFKAENDSSENDVGFFLNDSEILALNPSKPPSVKGGVMTIPLDEGKLTLQVNQWNALDESAVEKLLKKSKYQIHDIENIKAEYLSD